MWYLKENIISSYPQPKAVLQLKLLTILRIKKNLPFIDWLIQTMKQVKNTQNIIEKKKNIKQLVPLFDKLCVQNMLLTLFGLTIINRLNNWPYKAIIMFWIKKRNYLFSP